MKRKAVTAPNGPYMATKAALRRLILARSGLLRWRGGAPSNERGEPWRHQLHGEEGILTTIRRLEAVQLDPVAVIAPNHHLVLRNRVGDYGPEDFEAVYRHKRVFEYMANARCVLPIEDFPLFNPHRQAYAAAGRWPESTDRAMEYVRGRLGSEGPLPSRLLDSGEKVKGYWDLESPSTKASSQALEHLWEIGQVVVAARRGDERVFALTTDWLPADIPREGACRENGEALLRKYLQAFSVFDAGDWRFGWRKQPAAAREAAVRALVAAGEITPLVVEGVRRQYYVLTNLIPLLESLSTADVAPDLYVVPPLDNILWRRERLADLFGFDYRWEIYLPTPKRRDGPYTMPLLEGDRFIGRIDARLDRAKRCLHVNLLRFEPGIRLDRHGVARLRAVLSDLARYLGAEGVDADEGVRALR